MIPSPLRPFASRGKQLLERVRHRLPAANPALDAAPNESLATEQELYHCYRLILGRNPDRAGWEAYQAILGNVSGPNLASFFLTSPEFKARPVFRKMVGENPEETPVLVALPTHKQWVSPSDFQVSRVLREQREYEPHVARALQAALRPGMTVLDIGANIGYFSLLGASLVGPQGKVIAFEPNQYNCGLLWLSAQANQFTQIDIYPFAVADVETTLVYDNLGGSNGMVSDIPADVEGEALRALLRRVLVRSVRLDEQLRNVGRVDAIKIDIDGAEFRALQGAQALLAAHHPLIFSEFAPIHLGTVSRVSGEAYLRLLLGHGYKIGVIEPYGAIVECGDEVGQVMGRFNDAGADHIDIVAYLPSDRERMLGGSSRGVHQ